MAQTDFETNKYLVVKNAIPKEMADLITHYTLFQKHHTQTNSNTDTGKFEKYGDYLTEALLITLLPEIEKHTGLNLYPTFSTYRVYGPGDSVQPHIERPSCEISVVLNLGFGYETEDDEYTWPIWVNEEPFVINPGDMLIYKGLDLPTKRDPFAVDSGWQSEAVLNYVDADGNFAACINDARQNLGYPEWTQDQTVIKAVQEQWERSRVVSE